MNKSTRPSRRKPALVRRPTCHPIDLPTEPGNYYWTEWRATVEVVRRGSSLWAIPPGPNRIPVKVTPFIAGKFRREA